MLRFTLIAALAVSTLSLAADAPPPNAVQKEMQALHALTVTALTAIENGELAAIPPAVHPVHLLKSETEKALASGAWKPKQGGTTHDFIREDEAFHPLLVKLVQASKKNDVQAASKALGEVIQGCTACHVKFRFPPAPAAGKPPAR